MKCPTCGNLIEWENNPFRPFCSERCKLLDLGAWVNGEYSVPGEATEIPTESEPGAEPFPVTKDQEAEFEQ